jgi:hypothetical protein
MMHRTCLYSPTLRCISLHSNVQENDHHVFVNLVKSFTNGTIPHINDFHLFTVHMHLRHAFEAQLLLASTQSSWPTVKRAESPGI